MNEDRTSRRVWDYRQPYSAEDRNDRSGEFQERGPGGRGQGWGRRGHAAYDDAFGEGRHADQGYGAGRFGEGRSGGNYQEPMGDNPYGTYPSTREVMRGDRGAPEGGWNRGWNRQDRPESRQSQQRGQWPGEQYGGGRFPDQSRTPWRDRYEPDDPEARERMANAYGISDVGQLDAQSWQQESEGMGGGMQDNMQRRSASSRWQDAGGRYPESERPGAGGRAAGWPGDDWDQAGHGQPHGRDSSYEQFTSSPMRARWGQSSPGTASRRVAPKGYRRSDERIQEDLCERLAHDHRIDVEHVEVRVRDGVVTLSGTVRDRQQKFHIEDVADDTFGVSDVENQIRVERDGSRGGSFGSSGSVAGSEGSGSEGSSQGGGKVQQPGVSHDTRPDDGHISGVSVAGANTGSTASSYTGGMEVGAGEVPRGTDPHGGTTQPMKRST